jgi:copper homeostasis protein CutC
MRYDMQKHTKQMVKAAKGLGLVVHSVIDAKNGHPYISVSYHEGPVYRIKTSCSPKNTDGAILAFKRYAKKVVNGSIAELANTYH